MELAKKWSLSVSYLHRVEMSFRQGNQPSGLTALWRSLRDIHENLKLYPNPSVAPEAREQYERWAVEYHLDRLPVAVHSEQACEDLLDGIMESLVFDPDMQSPDA